MEGKVAIVILNYNGKHFLEQFLPSVIRHSKGQRIVVADNASTDGSVPFLQSHFPEVEVLIMEKNLGFAGGYNAALSQVASEYYLLLNSDVEVTSGWLSPMLQLLEEHPQIAACQPKILSYHQPTHFEYAGAAGGLMDILGYPFCRGRIFDTLEEDRGQYNDPRPVFWATGACMLVRARVFQQTGGFDESFFAHMEEIDLCWRMHRAGYQVYACPQSRVYHVGGGTLPKHNPQKTYLNFRNNLRMLYKNSSGPSLWWKIPCRHLLDWLAAGQFLLKGQRANVLAIGKAQLHFWRYLPVGKRKKVMKCKQSSGKIPLFKGSILWDYYIRRVRTYSELTKEEEGIGIIQKQPLS